ncbi:hypothetical protein NUW58_g2956 [Xylaria curta]|uniref:Uncharacterized protein n=1 Tax=Xylaria curta TaxID=42375 RepID=A0ACC1PEV9_9PEZI|nr:hypothetical protein NUW58_g2956 [Xylaria curta]
MDPVLPREYLSDHEYPLDPRQADHIVEAVSYYNTSLRESVIWLSRTEEKTVAIWASMARPFPRHTEKTLGYLDTLPLEILLKILESIDLRSLFEFRNTTARARQVVDSEKYRRAFEDGYILFGALVKMEWWTKVSLYDIYKALRTSACEICGEYGGFMSILLWKRCCYMCLRTAPELRMQSVTNVRKYYGVGKSQTNQLTQLQSLPGFYGMSNASQQPRISVVSVNETAMFFGRPPPEPKMWEGPSKCNFIASCPLPFVHYDASSQPVIELGVSCLGCYWAMSQKDIPTLSFKKDELCEKIYTRDGFLRHFQWCKPAQRMWKTPELLRPFASIFIRDRGTDLLEDEGILQ